MKLMRVCALWSAMVLGAMSLSGQTRPFAPADLMEWREIDGVEIHSGGDQVVYAERQGAESRLWLASTDGKTRRALRQGSAPRWSPDATRLAFLSATRVGVIKIDEASEALTVTPEGVIAFAWSPDGRTIAYTARVSEPSQETQWAPPALLPQLRMSRVRLFLVPAAGGEARSVPLGGREPEGDFAWMPDGRSLLMSLSAPFDPEHPLEGPEIYSVRVADFELRRLTRRAGPDFHPVPSPDGSRIAWLSREPAARLHSTAKLWVANADGSRARILAGSLDRDPVQPAWSSDSRTVYFLAEDRGETRVYAARNDGSVRVVLSAPRLHDFSLADNGRAAAVRGPEELESFPVDLAGTPAVLAAPNRELLAARSTGAVSRFEYQSAGRTIEAWITRPPGFDAGRKYPLVLAIDDTPRRMCSGALRLEAQILASAGMLVLCANARGAPGYGEEFASIVRTGFPGDGFADWMAGLDAAIAREPVDPQRVSILGGLSAAWAIGHTDRFRSAVLRRPIADFTLEAARHPQLTLSQMGAMPWADPEQYTRHSPIYAAGAFKTPALIVAEANDPSAQELYAALRWQRVRSALIHPVDPVSEMEAVIGWLKQ